METTHIKGIGVRAHASPSALGLSAAGCGAELMKRSRLAQSTPQLDRGSPCSTLASLLFGRSEESLARLLLDAAAGTGLSSPQRLV